MQFFVEQAFRLKFMGELRLMDSWLVSAFFFLWVAHKSRRK